MFHRCLLPVDAATRTFGLPHVEGHDWHLAATQFDLTIMCALTACLQPDPRRFIKGYLPSGAGARVPSLVTSHPIGGSPSGNPLRTFRFIAT
jgi:hypothetical protein